MNVALLSIAALVAATINQSIFDGTEKWREHLCPHEALHVCEHEHIDDECDEIRAFDPPSLTIPVIENPGFDMYGYFNNLQTYSADNTNGSCGYVALAQYLSYYDTFLSDQIIPEDYDYHLISASTLAIAKATSPGVLRSAYPTSSSALYDYVMANKDHDLQARMMYVVNTAKGRNRYTYLPSVGLSDYNIILNDLLYANGYIYSTFEYFENYTDSSVQSYYETLIKSKIDNGEPVIVQIAPSSGVDHAVVAYDYDNNHIYANYGYNGTGWNHMHLLNTNYVYIVGVAYTNITFLSHVHANNYIVQTLPYCGCGQHVHAYRYSSINATSHSRKCRCGYSGTALHIFEVDGETGVRRCIDCGYEE